MNAPNTLEQATVLVVEDHALCAKLIRTLLQAEGFKVYVSGDAEEAWFMLSRIKPHAILVDLVLPGTSGLVFAEQLRREPHLSGIAVIAMTAFSGPEVERLAARAGCAELIQKPIDVVTLPATVSRHIARA